MACADHGASQGDDLYVMINAWQEALPFEIQEGSSGDWLRVVDTARESPNDFCDPGSEEPLASAVYQVAPRSVIVLVRRR